MEEGVSKIDGYFITSIDNEHILVDYYSSYKFISYDEFRSVCGHVIFVNEKALKEIMDVFPEIDGEFLEGRHISIFQLELCVGY